MNLQPSTFNSRPDPRLRAAVEAVALAGLLLAAAVAGLAALTAWGPRAILAGAKGGLPPDEAYRLFLAGERAWRQALDRFAKTRDRAAGDSAQALLRQALQYNPELISAHTRLADLLDLQGRLPEAFVQRAQAALLKANAAGPQQRQEIGRYAMRLTAWAQTMKAWSVAQDSAQFQATLLAGRLDLAATILSRLGPRMQDRAECFYMEAQLALALGDRPTQRKALRACLAANPAHRQAAIMLAFSAPDLESNQEAARALRAVLASYPQDAHLWHLLGIALFKAGQLQAAADALEEARRLAPYSGIVAHHLAQILEQTGQNLRARRMRQRARELAPGPDPPPLLAQTPLS